MLDAFKRVVAQVWAERGQYGLDAPASLLARVVVVVARDGQQIDHARIQGQEWLGQAREAFGQFADTGSFKAGVVNEDRAALTAGSKQCFSKRLRRVFPERSTKACCSSLPVRDRRCTLN